MGAHRASFRFFAELTDFLPEVVEAGRLTRSFDGSPSVKDQIEACGVPHTEVDLILADGRSVSFAYRLADGDTISVYPVFESFDIAAVTKVRPAPLRETRFVIDINLGKLARYLRLLGFDSVCDGSYDDRDLVDISVRDRRILLTKDRALLKHAVVTHGYFVREINPRTQIIEVVRRFDLVDSIDPFARCMECNGEIVTVDKGVIEEQLQPLTRRYFDGFRRCAGCSRIYWRGSHYPRLAQIVDEVATNQGGIGSFGASG